MRDLSRMHLRILGIRGIPANHGGFETFAERLSLYLRDRDWTVTVYCQEEGIGPTFEDEWHGIRRVRIPVKGNGAASTVLFDWKSTVHAARERGLALTLGYNTAVFCMLLRLCGVTNLINMDGIEWRRRKWGPIAKAWFWLNERFGCWLGNHLIADHPEIKRHLSTRVPASKITTIPYGANHLDQADPAKLEPFGIIPGGYAIVVARPEPENSILEMVRAWSRRHRGCKLVVLGHFDPRNEYAQQVMSAASTEIVFPGAIYEKPVIEALRFFARINLHGHQVGGTNPSLVEALGAGNPIIAHDNPFNRWVAGEQAARYFSDEAGCESVIEKLLSESGELHQMRSAAGALHAERFTWPRVLGEYESLLLDWSGAVDGVPVPERRFLGRRGGMASAPMAAVAAGSDVKDEFLDSELNDDVVENVAAG
ncbi:MAG: DUF1972 domain-containing protein [Panacagrimonas sp.]